jgi:hypothetical protein
LKTQPIETPDTAEIVPTTLQAETGMPNLDRDSFIALLNRLGDPDEAEALAAAREIDRRVRESGLTWSELLVPPSSATDAKELR